MHILVTGASGFVGTHLLSELKTRSHWVTAVGRTASVKTLNADATEIIDLSPDTNWEDILNNIDAVIHLGDGLRAFEGIKQSPSERAEQYAIDTTLNLAESARSAGVKNFIYLSSIKAVSGEYHENVLTELDPPSPTRPLYGRLKSQIEAGLFDIAETSAMKVIALRSPIIYGSKSGGNFRKLLEFADTAWPFPQVKASNKRSIISVSNLSDALSEAAENHPAKSGAYFIHDGEAIQVNQLIIEFRTRLNRPARLFVLPKALLALAELLPLAKPIINRLTRPLELSDEKFRHDFSWTPSQSTASALDEMVDDYTNSR